MFLEWGQGGASRQLAQGPCQKNKLCRKLGGGEPKKEKKVLLFLKSLFPIADLYLLILGGLVFMHTV